MESHPQIDDFTMRWMRSAIFTRLTAAMRHIAGGSVHLPSEAGLARVWLAAASQRLRAESRDRGQRRREAYIGSRDRGNAQALWPNQLTVLRMWGSGARLKLNADLTREVT